MGSAKKHERRKPEGVEGDKQPLSSEALPKVEGSQQRGVDGNGVDEWVAVQRRKKVSSRGEGKVATREGGREVDMS